MYIVEKVVQTTRERLRREMRAEALKSATSYRSIQSRRLETRIGKLHNCLGGSSNYTLWMVGERRKVLIRRQHLPLVAVGGNHLARKSIREQPRKRRIFMVRIGRLPNSRGGGWTPTSEASAGCRRAFEGTARPPFTRCTPLWINIMCASAPGLLTYTELQVKLGHTAGISIALLHESVCSLHFLQFVALPAYAMGSPPLLRILFSATSPAATGSAGESRAAKRVRCKLWAHLGAHRLAAYVEKARFTATMRPWSDER